MKIPQTLLKMEDFPDFDGDRKEKLLRTLNGFFTVLGAALNRGLTVTDNLAAISKDVVWRGEAVTVECQLPGNRRPAHVIVTRCHDKTSDVPASSGTPAWTSAASEKGGYAVKLHGLPNTTAGHEYRVTLLILGA